MENIQVGQAADLCRQLRKQVARQVQVLAQQSVTWSRISANLEGPTGVDRRRKDRERIMAQIQGTELSWRCVSAAHTNKLRTECLEMIGEFLDLILFYNHTRSALIAVSALARQRTYRFLREQVNGQLSEALAREVYLSGLRRP
jgi:hypothetical protein